jgi:hypothetical protein
MPAIQLYSAALTSAPNKVLVETSDVSEEATGIVRAGVTYVCKSSDAEAVSEKMVLDTEPPAYPVTVFRNQLQRGRLYQYQRTIEHRFGVSKIRGYYAGVLKRGQQPQLQTETETFSFVAPLDFPDIGRLTGIFDADIRFEREFPAAAALGRTEGANAVASLSFSGRANIIRRRFGAIVDDARTANALAASTLEQLVISITVDIAIQPQFQAWLLNIFGVNSAQALTTSRTPLDWMKGVPGSFAIANDISTEFITPSVAVFSGGARLQTRDIPIIFYKNVTTFTPPAPLT